MTNIRFSLLRRKYLSSCLTGEYTLRNPQKYHLLPAELKIQVSLQARALLLLTTVKTIVSFLDLRAEFEVYL